MRGLVFRAEELKMNEVYVHRDDVHDNFLVEYVDDKVLTRKEYHTLGETLRKLYALKHVGYEINMNQLKALELNYFKTA
jgi:hypothetical protein